MTHFRVSRWLPLAGVLLFVALSLYVANPPRPVAATAPATAFSAERAMREVAVIARRPHSIGTPDHDRVRDYLVQRCRALGLRVTVQDTTVVSNDAGTVVGARVQNVVALLPGRTPGQPGVLVLSHYDSQPHTPGAGDDGAGVAAALETMRALRAGPPLAHDVRWVFTDGEEIGLMGARAYAADTARLRREVGVVLNFEGRGNEGPATLFEVSPGNGWVVGEFAKAVPGAFGSSLFYEVYRHLPNDTDFTAFRASGLPGLNFAFVGGYSYYHSPVDTPGRLHPGTVQQQGDYMLPAVRHFGNIPLVRTPAPDSTFFNPLGLWLVQYDARWDYLLTLGAGLLLAAAAVQARRQGRLRLRGWLGGALAWVGGLLLLVATAWGLTRLVAGAYPQYAVFYDHSFYNVRAYHLAFVALGTAVFAAYYAGLLRWLRPDSLAGGALLVLAALQVLVQVKAPTTGFLLGFPLLFGAAAWWWSLRGSPPAVERVGPSQRAWAWLWVLPAVALLAPGLSILLTTAGVGPLLLGAAFFLAVLLGLLLPVLLPALRRADASGPGGHWAVPGVSGLVAMGALVAAHARSTPTAEFPQQTHVLYILDADKRQAYWVSSTPHADAWTRQFFTAPTFRTMPTLFPGGLRPLLHQKAPSLTLTLTAPTVEVVADSALPTGRHLRLLVRSSRPDAVSLLLQWPRSARLVRVAGHVVPLPDAAKPPVPTGAYATLLYYAAGTAGVRLEIETIGPGAFELVAVDRSLGLPAVPGIQPLPATMIPAPGSGSFTTQVKKGVKL
ncbi:M20/M25/M40 family metallo-hydrolase [Hymenobacter arizonensis]|uniref:Peptidase family M28 n=1 Tax=Hymenobacter arizonensis TaxID=1227077 RepID=A0A1I6BP75_HYMAR|nr:M20/M25/M40 family metallo-hydrolase [Hymenobacter arizonensis]SFQ82729.1 Peptidase family M28 [Hymenobacter arizonensis]